MSSPNCLRPLTPGDTRLLLDALVAAGTVGNPLIKPEILQVQARGEYLYAACGADGFRAFDIAFIDHKGFSERIMSAPVSPCGQKFFVHTRYATAVAGTRVYVRLHHASDVAAGAAFGVVLGSALRRFVR